MFKHTLFFILTLVLSEPLFADSGTAQDLFQKGLAAYQNKQYAEARDDFQKVLDQGNTTPTVLHNLALSAFQLDQKPLALALWRKALTLRPSYRPAREGRDFLETKMQMRPLERDSLSLWVHRNLEMLSFFDVLWFDALMIAILGWLGLRFWGKRAAALEEEQPLPPFPTALVGLILLFVGILWLTVMKGKDSANERATVISAKASARILPADDGVGIFDVSGGNEVLVKRHQNGWSQVQNAEGTSGWVKDGEILITSER